MRAATAACFVFATLGAACGCSEDSEGAGGTGGAGGSAGPPSCNSGEKCCGDQCLRVECRSGPERCACASTQVLDGWMPDAGVVESCASADGGLGCCLDFYSGTCECKDDAGPWCGWESKPVKSCGIPPCASNGTEGPACK